MSNSILYATNTSSQTVVATGTTLTFPSIARRYGNNCNVSGGTVELSGRGYYDIDTNLTFVAGGAGSLTVSIYQDGTMISGATQTVTVASGEYYAISIPAIARVKCCCGSDITVVVSGVAGVVSNATIVVTKE